MKLNKKKVILAVLIFLIICICIIKGISKPNNTIEFENEYETVDKSGISYQDDTTIEDLKKDISATGDSDIYEIHEEYDGRKILSVKASVKFKVAFAGIIKRSIPTLSESEEILNSYFPKKSGIWIENSSRNKILSLFNDSDKTNSEYSINDDGYLEIVNKNKKTDLDKKIENLMNGNLKYVMCISSVCYIIDELTGEILDYNFEEMDKYQILDIFKDEDNNIIFITENKNNQYSKNEILEELINSLQL